MPPFYGVTASADFALSWKFWLHLNEYVCLYIHMVPYGPYMYPYAYINLLIDGTRDVYVHTSSIWGLNACYALTGACFYIDALTRLCTAFHSLYVWVYIYIYIYIYICMTSRSSHIYAQHYYFLQEICVRISIYMFLHNLRYIYCIQCRVSGETRRTSIIVY